MKVIDADGAVLGRLASQIAKQLVKGEKVIVVNAEKAVITGRKEDIYSKYKQRIDRSDRANPKKGPKFPKTPDKLFKRAVRGMVGYTTKRGKNALTNLKVFIGTPSEFDGKAERHQIKPPRCSYTTLDELCAYLGWKG
ncbi:MAG: 50S ribosomal protein L13 [Candidatus Diapherotrites archaeon]|nr:50S ribosomal protein L13 [Candidatus Diapherotrites archaeon]